MATPVRNRPRSMNIIDLTLSSDDEELERRQVRRRLWMRTVSNRLRLRPQVDDDESEIAAAPSDAVEDRASSPAGEQCAEDVAEEHGCVQRPQDTKQHEQRASPDQEPNTSERSARAPPHTHEMPAATTERGIGAWASELVSLHKASELHDDVKGTTASEVDEETKASELHDDVKGTTASEVDEETKASELHDDVKETTASEVDKETKASELDDEAKAGELAGGRNPRVVATTSRTLGQGEGTQEPDEDHDEGPGDDLFWAWHGTTQNEETDATRKESFDWFGVRQRAKLCRERLHSAAGEEAASTVDSQATIVGPFDLLAVMTRLKSCWVQTTADGVTFQEYRPLTTLKKPQPPLTKRSAGSQKAIKKQAHLKVKSAPAEVVRRTPRASFSRPEFFIKRWPAETIHLRESFNPIDVKFAFETPFGGICGCPEPCLKKSCPNGILNIFCTEECCNYKGKCQNGRIPNENLRLARRRGASDLTVITVERIAAGVVLGEYVGEIKTEMKKKKQKAQDKPQVDPQTGYLYEIKRSSESHPYHTIYIDAKRMGGITRFLNHSCNAPAVFEEVRNGTQHSVVVVTTRELYAGEEVTVHYGNNLWFTCTCGEPRCQHRDLHKK